MQLVGLLPDTWALQKPTQGNPGPYARRAGLYLAKEGGEFAAPLPAFSVLHVGLTTQGHREHRTESGREDIQGPKIHEKFKVQQNAKCRRQLISTKENTFSNESNRLDSGSWGRRSRGSPPPRTAPPRQLSRRTAIAGKHCSLAGPKLCHQGHAEEAGATLTGGAGTLNGPVPPPHPPAGLPAPPWAPPARGLSAGERGPHNPWPREPAETEAE